jgi:hypothetical protein
VLHFAIELAPIVSTLASSLTDDDLIYVYYWAVPAFDYYFRGNSHPWIKGVEMLVNPDDYTKQLNELKAQKKRIWFVFSHYGHVDYEWEMMLQYVAAMKSLKQVHVEEGTFLYLAE